MIGCGLDMLIRPELLKSHGPNQEEELLNLSKTQDAISQPTSAPPDSQKAHKRIALLRHGNRLPTVTRPTD
jgi:hypothetical protein